MIKKSIVAFVLSVLVFLSFFFLPKKIVVKNIDCQSQYGPCSDFLLSEVKKAEGKNLTEAKSYLGTLLKGESSVKDYSVRYRLPDSLTVHIIQREAEFGISFRGNSGVALVGQDGYVLAFQENPAVPVLTVDEPPPNVGEKVKDSTLFALQLMKDMSELYQAKNAAIKDNSLVVEIKTGQTVIFPLEGDKQILIASLGVILTRLNSENNETKIKTGSGSAVIDLRFKNPVIR